VHTPLQRRDQRVGAFGDRWPVVARGQAEGVVGGECPTGAGIPLADGGGIGPRRVGARGTGSRLSISAASPTGGRGAPCPNAHRTIIAPRSPQLIATETC